MSSFTLVQEALAAIFAHTLGFINVRSVASLADVRTQILIEKPALVMIDATLKEGKAIVRLLSDRDRSVMLMAFCVDEAPEFVAEWSIAGVCACLGRTLSCKAAAELIETVISRRPQPRKLMPSASMIFEHSSGEPLTEREEEVARLIHAGLSNKDIAVAINVSVATVKSHVHNLLAKLGLQSRGKVAMWYASRRPLMDRRKAAPFFAALATSRDHTPGSLTAG